jgi:hypothetical protein
MLHLFMEGLRFQPEAIVAMRTAYKASHGNLVLGSARIRRPWLPLVTGLGRHANGQNRVRAWQEILIPAYLFLPI